MLARIAGGELDALEDLYDRYKTMAYSIAYRITNDADPRRGRRPGRLPRARGAMPPATSRAAAASRPGCCRSSTTGRSMPSGGAGPTTELPEIEAGRRPTRSPCPTSGPRWPPSLDAETVRERPRGALRRPARGHRARLLRRADPAGDRRADRHAARDGQEPDAPRPAGHAPRRSKVAFDMTGSGRRCATLTCDEVRDLARRLRPRRAGRRRGGRRARAPRDLPATRTPRSPSSGRVVPALRRDRSDRRAAGRPEGPDHGRRRRRPGGRGGAAAAPRPTGAAAPAASAGRRAGRAPAAPTRLPDAPSERRAGARGPRPSAGSCASPPSSPSPRSAAGTCCSRTSSAPPRRYEQERRGRPRRRRPARRPDRGPDRRGGDGRPAWPPSSADGDGGPRDAATSRRRPAPGLRGLGHRRRRRRRCRSAASRSGRPGPRPSASRAPDRSRGHRRWP